MRISVIAAHPDDAEIWCGGTIARHTRDGDTVAILGLYDQVPFRVQCAEESARRLGASYTSTPDLADVLPAVTAFAPDIIVTHWEGDTHPEHWSAFRIAEQCVIGLCKASRPPKVFYSFATYHGQGRGGQLFVPDFYVDVSSAWLRKVEAIRMHADQEPEEIIAEVEPIYRMFGNRIRTRYAEGFVENPVFGRLSSAAKIARGWHPFGREPEDEPVP